MHILIHISTACKRLFAVAWFCLIAGVPALCAEKTGATLAIIPKPAKMEVHRGVFVVGPGTKIYLEAEDGGVRRVGEDLSTLLSSSMGRTVPVQVADGTARHRNSIHLSLKAPATLGPEGYELSVSPDAIRLSAATAAGLFYGVQTLRQMLPPEFESHAAGEKRGEVPCVYIQDSPRFRWRGLMLDCSRTFQSVDYLQHTLDRMALYKLNVLQLHLTDDQGWRLEIKKYPELTGKGAQFPAQYAEPPSHQGFYTQEQMHDLVAYAARRHITIVPEIEMPGHSLAALSVMPQLSCTGGPFEIFPYFKGPGIMPEILCAGKEETFVFLRDVLDEVMATFPSEFVHIGGDEAPKTRWKACPHCQKRIQDEGLKNEAELQSWFNRRVERMLAAKGRRLIGWDEILEGGLSPTAAVMSWRGTAGGVAAAQAGHDVVMSPTSHCYFDYNYGAINSARVFSFDPVAGLTSEAAGRVLGLQANFWSHIDREPELVDAQLFPRLLALAERGWSPAGGRDWPDYRSRAQAHLLQLRRLGIHYHIGDLEESAVK